MELHWNNNQRLYVDKNGKVHTNWEAQGGITNEITFHRFENDRYFFRCWDTEKRLVSMRCVSKRGLQFDRECQKVFDEWKAQWKTNDTYLLKLEKRYEIEHY